jgi:hypothetical protein
LLYIRAGEYRNSGYPPPPESLFVDGLQPEEIAELVSRGRNLAARKLKNAVNTTILEFNLRHLVRGEDAATAFRGALRTRENLTCPLQRLHLAWSAGDRETVQLLQEEATLEYIIKRDVYEKLLGDRLPEFLRRKGEAFFNVIESDEFFEGVWGG